MGHHAGHRAGHLEGHLAGHLQAPCGTPYSLPASHFVDYLSGQIGFPSATIIDTIYSNDTIDTILYITLSVHNSVKSIVLNIL